jgi:hypothetical protein
VTLFAGAGGVLRSTDNGATWTSASNGLTSIPIYALATAPNASGGTDLYAGTSEGVFRSTDNGGSWSNVSFVFSSPQGLEVTPSGTLLAATETDVFRSTDGGATWTDTLVNQGATTLSDQFMPRATVDSHGNLVVAFLDRRLDPSDVLLWTWLAASSDGGTTFREYPLSDVGWDPSTTFNSAGKFLGMAAGDHGVGALFPDGRSGQLDVLWDHANLSLVATPAQISAAAGNAVAFDLGLGPNDGGGTYWLLGSLATSPPFVVGHATVDLALDPFFFFLLQATNTPNYANAMGTLDPQGHAIATLDPKGPFNPALVGTNLWFAAVNPVPGSEFATASIQVTIVP